MKYYLGDIYVDENGNDVFYVRVGKQTLKGFKATKRNHSKCKNCRFYFDCDQERVFRKYDCRINANKLKKAYKRLTAFAVTVWAFFVFSHFEFNFFYKMSLVMLSLTGFDILCVLLEGSVPKIYDWFFELKVKKRLKAHKKEKDAEEAKAKAEEEARIRDIPGYLGVKKARTITEKFSEISKQCDYGSNKTNINSCVESCEVIVKILEKDSSDYYRVSDVFELYLPRVCTTIEMYKKTMEADEATEQQQILFEQFIEAASKYLEKKKNEVIYYNNVDEINLKTSTDTLKESLQEETKK